MNIKPGFWNCCQAKPSKVVAFDDDRNDAPKGALVWHYACNSCASTVHPSRVLDAPTNGPVSFPKANGRGTTAAYEKDERLYFCPSLERMPGGSTIPAGMVIVTEVVDHGDSDPLRARWTYVVRHIGISISSPQSQGAAEEELHRWLGW